MIQAEMITFYKCSLMSADFCEVSPSKLILSETFSGMCTQASPSEPGNLACLMGWLFFQLPAPMSGSESTGSSISSFCLIVESC